MTFTVAKLRWGAGSPGSFKNLLGKASVSHRFVLEAVVQVQAPQDSIQGLLSYIIVRAEFEGLTLFWEPRNRFFRTPTSAHISTATVTRVGNQEYISAKYLGRRVGLDFLN